MNSPAGPRQIEAQSRSVLFKARKSTFLSARMPDIVDSPSATVSESKRKFSLFRIAATAVVIGFLGCFGWLTYLAFFGLEATTQRTTELLSSTSFDRFELHD